jgi:hypothetical protein
MALVLSVIPFTLSVYAQGSLTARYFATGPNAGRVQVTTHNAGLSGNYIVRIISPNQEFQTRLENVMASAINASGNISVMVDLGDIAEDLRLENHYRVFIDSWAGGDAAVQGFLTFVDGPTPTPTEALTPTEPPVVTASPTPTPTTAQVVTTPDPTPDPTDAPPPTEAPDPTEAPAVDPPQGGGGGQGPALPTPPPAEAIGDPVFEFEGGGTLVPVEGDDGLYYYIDEDGTPLGIIELPPGTVFEDLDLIDILDDLTPFGTIGDGADDGSQDGDRVNPPTGDTNVARNLLYVTILIPVLLVGLYMLRKKLVRQSL